MADRLYSERVERRRVPGRLALLVVAVSAAATVWGVVAYANGRLRPAPQHVEGGVRCYTSAEVGHGDDFAGVTRPLPATPSTPGYDAISVCLPLWRAGFLRKDMKRVATPDGEEHDAPPLEACRLADGTPAVFPGLDGTCKRLGLPELPY